jgi:CRP/FNR family transcriptional regulator, cyclic AMP receptor protein
MRPLTLTPALLRRVDALQQLDDPALEEFAELAEGTCREKGDEVVGHMDPSRDVYFILVGLVRVELFHTNGQYITFQLLPSGEMFGELSAIDGLGRSASVSVEEDAMLACMSQRRFTEYIDKHPAFSRKVMLRLAGLARHLTHRFILHAAVKVRGRVYSELMTMLTTQHASDDPTLIVPAPTDADIASRVGAGRPYVNRTLRWLVKQGVIERRDGGLKVLDADKLKLLQFEAESE